MYTPSSAAVVEAPYTENTTRHAARAVMPVAPEGANVRAGEPVGKLIKRCRRRADQHRQTAARWTRYAGVHEGPTGHAESHAKCLARVQRELRLAHIWGEYVAALERTHAALAN